MWTARFVFFSWTLRRSCIQRVACWHATSITEGPDSPYLFPSVVD
jgi:hypothetical protein